MKTITLKRSISGRDTSHQVSSQLAFRFRRRRAKYIFKIADRAAFLDLWSKRLSYFLIYRSPRYFQISFESTDLSVQEKKRKIDFQDGGLPSWISDRNDFSHFWTACRINTSYQFSSQLALECRRFWFKANCWHHTTLDRWRATHDGHWPITIAHLEHLAEVG